MFICPNCNINLVKTKGSSGVFWLCPTCDGRSATVPFLRKNMPKEIVNSLWQEAKFGTFPRKRHCPACNKLMAEVPATGNNNTEYIDVCTVCQFVWFDPGEYNSLPTIQNKTDTKKQLPFEAREKLAILKLDAIREEARGDEFGEGQPEQWWQWIPGILGMPIEQDLKQSFEIPWITWSLAVMIIIISSIAFFDLENVINSFGLIPAEAERYGGMTFFTSFFLHGSLFHLLGNIYFLLVFGDNVEDWLGKGKFILLLLLSSLVGDTVHIMTDQSSTIPCIGASGGISGIITFYALKFPHARLGFLFRFYPWIRWVRIPAYALFMLWIGLQCFGLWQQLNGISNVSSSAHLGGVFVGFIFWLLTRKVSSQ